MTRLMIGLLTLATAVAAAPTLPASRLPPTASRIRTVLPFTSNLVTGPFRGTQHCYVCDLHEEPAVLVFARRLDAPTAALLRGVRDAVRGHADRGLFGWFVFLGDPGPAAESRLEEDAFVFARSNEATTIPISALADPDGPPGYSIGPSAQVTVILFRQRKVLSRHSYTTGAWTLEAAHTALAGLPRLIAAAPRVQPTASSAPAAAAPVGPVDAR